MPEVVTMLMSVLGTVLVFGAAGKHVAQRRGLSPIIGMIVGAFLPLIGVGILLAWKQQRSGTSSS